MTKRVLNQKGLSLIELLATLSLLTIVGVLVFGVLINSLHIFEKQSDESDIRQEANLISNQLTTFYKINGNYKTNTNSDGVIEISSEKSDGTIEVREFSIPNYRIDVSPTDSTEGEQDKGSYSSRDISITISEIEDLSNKFTLNTNISRIKEDGTNEKT